MINPELVKLARYTVSRTKKAFQPPDPAAMGGMPPGAPPMDPAMMGMPPGAPPMDPAMMGMPPGGAPPMPPDMGAVPGAGGLTADTIRQIIQEEMAKSPLNQAGPGGAPGAMGKPGKPDLLAMSMDIFQMKKYMFVIGKALGVEPPMDIMDGPNRDPSTGAPMPPGMPGSTSDPNQQAPQEPAGGGGPQSAIQPPEPIAAAFPSGGGGGEKSSAASHKIGSSINGQQQPELSSVRNKAAALANILRRSRGK